MAPLCFEVNNSHLSWDLIFSVCLALKVILKSGEYILILLFKRLCGGSSKSSWTIINGVKMGEKINTASYCDILCDDSISIHRFQVLVFYYIHF